MTAEDVLVDWDARCRNVLVASATTTISSKNKNAMVIGSGDEKLLRRDLEACFEPVTGGVTVFIDDGVVVDILPDSCEAGVGKYCGARVGTCGAVIGWLLISGRLSWLATIEVSRCGCATPRMDAMGSCGPVEKSGKGPLVG